ncbi:hypothetical protein BDW02DRAFT_577682 [Decorospora gaudefroyi]|uniref:Uncharacterized protein n=1 Tax=Decorospora gaudefroyi TaxID=184978 RepID=A0A6A5KLU4_9PLEO|nr:hypothetical protein BDW02DRAFT_577682 [Decorospora gaudefroyi]
MTKRKRMEVEMRNHKEKKGLEKARRRSNESSGSSLWRMERRLSSSIYAHVSFSPHLNPTRHVPSLETKPAYHPVLSRARRHRNPAASASTSREGTQELRGALVDRRHAEELGSFIGCHEMAIQPTGLGCAVNKAPLGPLLLGPLPALLVVAPPSPLHLYFLLGGGYSCSVDGGLGPFRFPHPLHFVVVLDGLLRIRRRRRGFLGAVGRPHGGI